MCCSVVVGVMFKFNEFMGLHQDTQRDIFLKTADLQRENRSLTVKVKITTFFVLGKTHRFCVIYLSLCPMTSFLTSLKSRSPLTCLFYLIALVESTKSY
jgi:hypothetical protein